MPAAPKNLSFILTNSTALIAKQPNPKVWYTKATMGSFDRGNRGGGRSFGGGGGGFGGPRRDFGPRNDRPLFKATCSNCGRDCEVPFRPTNGKPVYCSDCFEKLGRGNQEGGRSERQEFRAPAGNPNGAQLEAISVKLDKIIRLLEPKVVVTPTPAPVVEKVEVVNPEQTKSVEGETAPKAKKSTKKGAIKK